MELEEIAAVAIQPLFGSDLDSDSEDANPNNTVIELGLDSVFGRLNRVPISSSGSITASKVQESHKDVLSGEIFNSCNRGKKPVLLKGACFDWPLVQGTSCLENLKSLFSSVELEREIDVLASKDGINFLRHELCDKVPIALGQALESIFDNEIAENRRLYMRLYLDVYSSLKSYVDFEYLKQLAVGGSIQSAENSQASSNFGFKESNIGLWFSSSGCITPLHFDICHGFLCQASGTKRFCLVSPEDTPYVYWKRPTTIPVPSFPAPISSSSDFLCADEEPVSDLLDSSTTSNGTSSIANVTGWLQSGPNQKFLSKYPLLSDVNWWVADLEPGDILYTPPGWWHTVISITNSASFLVPFDPVPYQDMLPSNVLSC